MSIPTNKSIKQVSYNGTIIPLGTTPTGSISIASNGTYDVTNYASAIVNVPTQTISAKSWIVTLSSNVTSSFSVVTGDSDVASHYNDVSAIGSVSLVQNPSSLTNNQVFYMVSSNHFMYYTGSASSPTLRYGLLTLAQSGGTCGTSHGGNKLSATSTSWHVRATSSGNIDVFLNNGSMFFGAGTYIVTFSW